MVTTIEFIQRSIFMPSIDLTITISTILGLSSVVVPSITTLLNNRHLYKMKKLEEAAELRKSSYFYKRGIFEDYLRYTGQCITNASVDPIENYGASYALALIYFPEDFQDKIIALNADIRSYKWENALQKLNDLAPLIRIHIQKLLMQCIQIQPIQHIQ